MTKAKFVELIASNLRAARANASLTLRDAGAKAGVNYVTLSRYENGLVCPKLSLLVRLAHLYGIAPADLIPAGPVRG